MLRLPTHANARPTIAIDNKSERLLPFQVQLVCARRALTQTVVVAVVRRYVCCCSFVFLLLGEDALYECVVRRLGACLRSALLCAVLLLIIEFDERVAHKMHDAL